jgi:hypothetical protein
MSDDPLTALVSKYIWEQGPITIQQIGAGQVTIAYADGVIVRSSTTLKLFGQSVLCCQMICPGQQGHHLSRLGPSLVIERNLSGGIAVAVAASNVRSTPEGVLFAAVAECPRRARKRHSPSNIHWQHRTWLRFPWQAR